MSQEVLQDPFQRPAEQAQSTWSVKLTKKETNELEQGSLYYDAVFYTYSPSTYASYSTKVINKRQHICQKLQASGMKWVLKKERPPTPSQGIRHRNTKREYILRGWPQAPSLPHTLSPAKEHKSTKQKPSPLTTCLLLISKQNFTTDPHLLRFQDHPAPSSWVWRPGTQSLVLQLKPSSLLSFDPISIDRPLG